MDTPLNIVSMMVMGQPDTEWIFTMCWYQSGRCTIEYSLCVRQGQVDTPLNITLMIVMGQPDIE